MRGCTQRGIEARASFSPSSLLTISQRLAVVLLVVAVALASAPGAEAASLTVNWNAPTTNADGSRLTDLSSYRLYLGTGTPACPGASFHSVSATSSSPSAGQVMSTQVTGLSGGTTYIARITAVDAAGNESACSSSASGVAHADLTVTPTTATSFGSVPVNGTADRTFTVQNAGATTISGTVTVGAPFSIQSGGSFSLAAGASQTVTVRFKPTAAGTFAGNVNFTGAGDTASRAVSGATTTVASAALTVTKNGTGSGTVASSTPGISCGSDCSESLPVGTAVTLTATAASGSTFAGWGGGCSGSAATCSWTMNAATTVSARFDATTNQPPNPGVPVLSSLTPSTAAAGSPASTLTVTGSGFAATSVVRWNGANRPTTFVSASQLTAAITAADLASARSVPVSVVTPAPGGGTSGTVNFVVTAASSAVPAAPGSPSVTQQGSDASGVSFSVSFATVPGAASYPYVAAFTDGTGVRQGSTTTVPLQLRMAYHASGVASGAFICVRSANAAGKQSTDQSCNVLSVPARPVGSTPPPPPPSAPAPSASSLSPSSAQAGSGGFTLTVNGSGFVAASVVRWNGGTRATTFVSASQLRASIGASDVASTGPASVTVFTPTPGGGTSGTLSFAITAPPAPPTPQEPPAPATPPGTPGNPSVTQVSADATGVTFAVTWAAGAGSASYRYAAAFTDGSGFQQGSVNGMLSFQLRMPYYRSGAANGAFVCIRSVGTGGQQSADQACNALTVPAQPR